MVDPFDLEGQAVALEERERRGRIAASQEKEEIKWLMGGAMGRGIAWRLLDAAGVFRSSFDANALQMARKEGERNAGLRLLGLIFDSCPEHFITMLSEQRHVRDRGSEDRSKSKP